MNILIFNWRDIKHPLAGGAEVMLLEHAKAWSRKGAKIVWFSSKTSRQSSHEQIDGIDYIRRGNHFTVFVWAFLYYLQGKFKSPDIVVDCFHFFPFFTPLFIRKKKIVGVIHEVAGKVWFQNLFYPLAFIGYYIEPLIIRLYKKKEFITVSKSTKKELEKIGLSSSQIHVIENGVSPISSSGGKRDMKSLLFLGRISKDKGVEDAIDAFKVLHDGLPNLHLMVVGKSESNNYLETIKERVKQLHVAKNVTFSGFVSEKEKYKLLGSVALLLHPSQKEGWGLTVIEANAVGTPVVGYDVEGLRDSIVNGKTGLLVAPNSESLAKGVRKVLRDKKLYSEYSKNAKEWSKKFTWRESTEKSFKIIKSL